MGRIRSTHDHYYRSVQYTAKFICLASKTLFSTNGNWSMSLVYRTNHTGVFSIHQTYKLLRTCTPARRCSQDPSKRQ